MLLISYLFYYLYLFIKHEDKVHPNQSYYSCDQAGFVFKGSKSTAVSSDPIFSIWFTPFLSDYITKVRAKLNSTKNTLFLNQKGLPIRSERVTLGIKRVSMRFSNGKFVLTQLSIRAFYPTFVFEDWPDFMKKQSFYKGSREDFLFYLVIFSLLFFK